MWSLNPLSETLCQHIWENLFRVVKNNVILMQFGLQWRRGVDVVAMDEDKEAKFFFFVSSIITQQFNNHTISSMTTH